MGKLSEGSIIVNGDLAGLNIETIIVNNKAYSIAPPTIAKLSKAAYYLPNVSSCENLQDIIHQMKSLPDAAKALSCFICGETTYAKEFEGGTIEEIVEGLETAYSMLSMLPFKKLSGLAMSVMRLTVNPKS